VNANQKNGSGAALVKAAPHVLIIDDKPDDVRAILRAMRLEDWKVSASHDARQALQRALILRPDLILLDVQMPHMDGFTFCRLLREADGMRRTPIIFLTSAGSLADRLEGLQLGGVDYVLKPYEPAEVLARIRVHLQLQQQLQELATPSPASVKGVSEDQMLLRAATRIISQNLGDLPSLVDLARSVGTHDKRLSRLFRQHMGITVFAYVRDLRLRKSQELLVDSDMSVQDIADWVGYTSACNFTTAFRQKTGVTPSQFRQQAKNVQVN